MKRRHTWLRAAPFVAVATFAHAGPDEYVAVPGVEYGEREIELRYGAATRSGAAHSSAASLAFGYGATPWWFTEVYAKFNREGGRARYDAFEWENKFQLTEPGERFIDVGLLVEIEVPRLRGEGYELRIGPLLQKDFDRVQINFNPLLERDFHADEHEATALGYQWQAKYRWRPEFEFGAQGFGDVGPWNHWLPVREQAHVLGPAMFGKATLALHQAVKYNAALLFKASSAAPQRTLRAQLEYEF